MIEHDGVQWMKDPSGNFLRWDDETRQWIPSPPPAPEVIRKFDAAAEARERGWRGGRSAVVVTLTVATMIGLALWALVDPHAQIPVFSKVVCSLKGASWQEGSPILGIPPGCYARPFEEDSLSSGDEGSSDESVTHPVLETALKNAATSQESYAVSNDGEYTPYIEDLYEHGLEVPPGVNVNIVTLGEAYYCLEADDDLGTTFYYDSNEGYPREGHCIGD